MQFSFDLDVSEDYLDKLEHICGAGARHIYEEEGTWFPELKGKLPTSAQAKLTFRYLEEFRPYMGRDFQEIPEVE